MVKGGWGSRLKPRFINIFGDASVPSNANKNFAFQIDLQTTKPLKGWVFASFDLLPLVYLGG